MSLIITYTALHVVETNFIIIIIHDYSIHGVYSYIIIFKKSNYSGFCHDNDEDINVTIMSMCP